METEYEKVTKSLNEYQLKLKSKFASMIKEFTPMMQLIEHKKLLK